MNLHSMTFTEAAAQSEAMEGGDVPLVLEIDGTADLLDYDLTVSGDEKLRLQLDLGGMTQRVELTLQAAHEIACALVLLVGAGAGLRERRHAANRDRRAA